MGTNYYFRDAVCPTCGRSDELHIGKSSFGWCFSLHVYPEKGINDLPDWQKLWGKPGSEIRDEYEKLVAVEDMLERITQREGPTHRVDREWLDENHADPGPDGLVRHRIDGVRCIGHGTGTWDLEIGEFS